MIAKHTPGPWVVGDAPDSRVAVYGGDCCVAVVGEQGYPVVDADAALISAAPDMLAALEELLLERYALEDPEEFDQDGHWTSTSPASVKARAAIAKAKGEA